MTTFTMDDLRIARNGAMSYNPRVETFEQGAVRCALESARDMYAYRHDTSAYVEWEPSMFEWDGDFPMAEGTVLLDATLYVDGEHVASLASVNVYSEHDDYCRTIEGELYGEYVYEIESRRQLMTVRGEN